VTRRPVVDIAASVRQILSDAIRGTFTRRGTEISESPVALTKAFADDPAKILQWRAFVRNTHIPAVPESFEMIRPVSEVRHVEWELTPAGKRAAQE